MTTERLKTAAFAVILGALALEGYWAYCTHEAYRPRTVLEEAQKGYLDCVHSSAEEADTVKMHDCFLKYNDIKKEITTDGLATNNQ